MISNIQFYRMLNFFKKTQSQDPQEVKNKTSLKERLFKSKKKLGDGLSSLVIGKKKIDEDLLEELEMLLIGSCLLYTSPSPRD